MWRRAHFATLSSMYLTNRTSVTHSAIDLWATQFCSYHIWHRPWSITNQTHGNMNMFSTTTTSLKRPLSLVPADSSHVHSYFNLSTMETATKTPPNCTLTFRWRTGNPFFYCKRSPNLVCTACRGSLLLFSFCFIDAFWFTYRYAKISISWQKMLRSGPNKKVSYYTPTSP